MEARGVRRAGGNTGRRRVLQAAVAIALAGVVSVIWADPAHGSTAVRPWQPQVRNLHGANAGVMEGERQSRNIARTHATILFVGDSITQWWQRFGLATWDHDFAPLDAVDDGVAGDTTSNVLARIDDGSLAGLDPAVTVLMIGTNNIPLHQTAADIARGILAIAADLQHRLPDTQLILLAVLPRDQAGSPDRRAVAAIDRLLGRDAPAAHVTYLNLGPLLLESGGRFRPGMMNPDLLHPAAPGYAAMGAALLPVVRGFITRP